MTPPSLVGAVVGGLYGHAVPDTALLGVTAAVLAWNGMDLLVRPFHARPRERPRAWPAVVLGFGIGLVGGAIGLILGTLRMPALLRGVGMDTRRAIGTNLVVGFALGIAGFAAHRRGSRWTGPCSARVSRAPSRAPGSARGLPRGRAS
jgi:uncharacterized membrane protein YfcA